jgi:tRNA pseudouridine55 synthase
MIHQTYKKLGETPLEATERLRAELGIDSTVPMTYAGRLDPLAEGVLIVLSGDDCKDEVKSKYLGLDKEYTVDVLLGLTTDTYDLLGMPSAGNAGGVSDIKKEDFVSELNKYIGKFEQEYPLYSSRNIALYGAGQGGRVGSLAQDGEKNTKNVEIYSADLIGESQINPMGLFDEIVEKISLVKGDFRQEKIVESWKKLLLESVARDSYKFKIYNIKVKCSSGTYMRSLAHNIGKNLGCGALAKGINRTEIKF